MEIAHKRSKQFQSNGFLNLPAPDRAIMMQSPPPAEDPATFEAEDAPCKAGPIDFMPAEAGKTGKLIFKAKFLKTPTIIIESE
jgi:hypothetical protein